MACSEVWVWEEFFGVPENCYVKSDPTFLLDWDTHRI